MPKSLTQKILESHLVEGRLIQGEEISIRIDQTLLQDATGTIAMLEFETLGIERVKAELAVQYVDHNILQTDNKNADDHMFLRTACAKYGVYFSPPGNGICHQVHMERFGVPGKIVLGADSHTPGAAGVSMLGIGAGGLDVALAMAGMPYSLPCPKVLGVRLTGHLPDWVSAKDVILEMLRRYDVKGCVGKVVEYYGPGVKALSATDRETIGNMGTELGATSTVFPSDENTLAYLKAQGREEAWQALQGDEGATYDEHGEMDLSSLEPLIACPSSPGNVVPVREVAGRKVHQVIIGSSVNSSFRDLMVVANIIKGRRRFPGTDLHINPGSKQVLQNVMHHGGLMSLLSAGARIHESGCLGCIGMGQAPGSGQISLRTFPRNFPGRSGTKDDQVYLCSPETGGAAALKGVITDPRDLAQEMTYPKVHDPEEYLIDRMSVFYPSADPGRAEVIRGPNIRPLPNMEPLPATLEGNIVIKVGDNVSTDTIMPAGSTVLPLRSNIEAISTYVFYQIDPEFHRQSKKAEKAVVIGGENYGQGSSREHAALGPRYLGVRVKITKSFARIHKANLCNFGILPLVFKDPSDYDRLTKGQKVVFPDIRRRVENRDGDIPVEVGGQKIMTVLDVSERQRKHLLAGGALNFVKEQLRRS
ncbi:MAG: aconitate hydratase [Deltaproteobacteria bacterium]|nr:aconitate hydratase [Deltaproteobacteria bacterium]